MGRLPQIVLIVSFIAFSWLGFMAVHECGHVLAAWLSGGKIDRVVLHPLQISWSSFQPNPHPLLVAWGGPMFGCVIPITVAALAKALRFPTSYLFRFFAGFCCVANGLYMVIDAFERSGDGKTLSTNGAAAWQLLVFGALMIPCGFWLWHGLGPHFGLGSARGQVSRKAVSGSLAALTLLIGIELLLQ